MITDKLKEIRKANNMNKKEFAEFLNMKYTTYNNYETGAREPSSDFLIHFSKQFDTSIDYLLGLKDEKEILHSYELKASEFEHIKKYRILNQNEKKAVDDLIDTLSNKYPKGYNADLKWFDDPTQARIFIEQAQGTMLPTMGERKHDISDDDACEIATNLFHKLNG